MKRASTTLTKSELEFARAPLIQVAFLRLLESLMPERGYPEVIRIIVEVEDGTDASEPQQAI